MSFPVFHSLTSAVWASLTDPLQRKWQWLPWTTVTSPWLFALGSRSGTIPAPPRARRPGRRSKNSSSTLVFLSSGHPSPAETLVRLMGNLLHLGGDFKSSSLHLTYVLSPPLCSSFNLCAHPRAILLPDVLKQPKAHLSSGFRGLTVCVPHTNQHSGVCRGGSMLRHIYSGGVETEEDALMCHPGTYAVFLPDI